MKGIVSGLVLVAAVAGACGKSGPSAAEIASSSASSQSSDDSSVSRRNSGVQSNVESRKDSMSNSEATAAAGAEIVATASALLSLRDHVGKLQVLFGSFGEHTRPGPETASTLGTAASEFSAVAQVLRGLDGSEPTRSLALEAVEEAESDLRKAQALCGSADIAVLCLEPMASVNASTGLAFDRLNTFVAAMSDQ